MTDLNLERGLPANADAERTILGAALMDNEALIEAGSLLLPSDFSLESHRRIFERMLEIVHSGSTADVITVSAELARRKEVESVGGIAYVSALMDGLPRRPSVRSYAEIVKDKANLRAIIHTSQAIAAAAVEQQQPARDLIASFEQDLLAINAGMGGADRLFPQVAFETMNRIHARADSPERLVGFPTGVTALDEPFCGYVEGQLTVIGARPRVGKTSMVADGTITNLERGTPVQVFSLEMDDLDMTQRLLIRASGVPAWKVQKPWHLSKEERHCLQRATERISGMPLRLEAKRNIKPEALLSKAKLAVRRDGIKLVFIDFFMRMDIQPRKGERDTREAANRTTKMLADFASGEKVAVVLLSQLNRFQKGANDLVPPSMENLRETGGLEENANNVLLLHRPIKDSDWTGEDQIIIAKQREGEMKPVNVAYDDERLAFMPRFG